MKSLKVILNSSNPLFYSKVQCQQSLKSISKSISTNKALTKSVCGSKIQALTTSNNATDKKIYCLVQSTRCLSNESHMDVLLCPSELRRVLKEGNCVLVDTRTERETLRTGVIPGSICVPLDQLESALNMSPDQFLQKYCAEKPNTDQKIIFVCRRGSRSFKAAKLAREMGFEEVYSIQGGFMHWFDLQRRIRVLQNGNEQASKEDSF